jgi:hypothetical protein
MSDYRALQQITRKTVPQYLVDRTGELVVNVLWSYVKETVQ